ncbi:hypothetical protein [Streptomyces sp. MZ04]|uniref:hypothetical protein n=1 Tax=Streptomyces sp. MZ04 TaxID=2559236 RepID=UPI00107E97A5|nr:hypothetical protein [Streptomyces sp. MZ04]TGB06545.1 hypothetical protein E2651_23320 [Streptomyces sp. MZ04]
MDIDRLMTQDGMREYTDGQRDQWASDVAGVETLTQVIEARLAQTVFEGDRPGAAKRRAKKVAKRLRKASQQVRKAAAEVEAANAVFNREVVELPARRTRQQEIKARRDEQRARLRGLAKLQVARALAESAHGFNTDPQQVTTPAAPPAPQQAQLLNPTPYAMPPAAGGPLGEITDQFPQVEFPEAM